MACNILWNTKNIFRNKASYILNDKQNNFKKWQALKMIFDWEQRREVKFEYGKFSKKSCTSVNTVEHWKEFKCQL